MSKPKLKIEPIQNGTVIDHITANKALYVLKILKLPDKDINLSLAMNVPSKTTGSRKDIVKIENRELKPDELKQVALIAPKATINIIRDYKIIVKDKVKFMEELNSLLKCTNPNCITNTEEPIESRFYLIKKAPILFRCHYCERLITEKDIVHQFN